MAREITIIGGGPAGLMAAEILCHAGQNQPVRLYDSMPSLGRKFLMAGKSGLNLSHAEPAEQFYERFGMAKKHLASALETFDSQAIRDWAGSLDIVTFIGSTGRIFPTGYKAAPLLRNWLRRLRAAGLDTRPRHRWTGWEGEELRFETPTGTVKSRPSATILALGGGSWSRLGSDAAWRPWLEAKGIDIAPFQPANCGFDVGWSDFFRNKFEGQPVKGSRLSFAGLEAGGDFVITRYGIESGPVYSLSARLRDQIKKNGSATLYIDLLPHYTRAELQNILTRPRGSQSMASFLRKNLSLSGVKAGLMRECLDCKWYLDSAKLAIGIKKLPLCLRAPRPLDEAISSAGGISFDALDDHYMLRQLPGVFCSGEMLDWEAPSGGYLLSACLATGRAAGLSARRWLEEN